MAGDANGGGNGGLYFIVGALVVLVGLGAYMLLGGHLGSSRTSVTEQTTSSAPGPGTGSTTTTTTTKKSN